MPDMGLPGFSRHPNLTHASRCCSFPQRRRRKPSWTRKCSRSTLSSRSTPRPFRFALAEYPRARFCSHVDGFFVSSFCLPASGVSCLLVARCPRVVAPTCALCCTHCFRLRVCHAQKQDFLKKLPGYIDNDKKVRLLSTLAISIPFSLRFCCAFPAGRLHALTVDLYSCLR
jgi:hypothetical protein